MDTSAGPGRPRTSLFTDHYELTMFQAALHSGAAHRRSVFQAFARGLPAGRRYGIVAGTGRLLEGIADFRFDADDLDFLAGTGVVNEDTLDHLAAFRFSGDIWGYPEGEAYFPHSPVLIVESTFAEACVLETYVLSVLNHDSAIASAASRMVSAAGGRPCIEMGSRRTHEEAAAAAARAAVIAGFSRHVQPGRRPALTASGPSAPRRTPSPCCTTPSATPSGAAGLARARAPRCSWTRTTSKRPSAPPSTSPGTSWARSGSTPGTSWRRRGGSVSCWTAWATCTRRSSSPRISTNTPSPRSGPPRPTRTASARRWSRVPAPPPPAWSTSWSAGPTTPVSSIAVAKSSKDKINVGGRKIAVRRLDGSRHRHPRGPRRGPPAGRRNPTARPLLQQFIRDGEILPGWTGPEAVARARDRHAATMAELPAVVDRLQRGRPAIPTIYA